MEEFHCSLAKAIFLVCGMRYEEYGDKDEGSIYLSISNQLLKDADFVSRLKLIFSMSGLNEAVQKAFLEREEVRRLKTISMAEPSVLE